MMCIHIMKLKVEKTLENLILSAEGVKRICVESLRQKDRADINLLVCFP